jgi:geranylgeranyl reductase family protein
MNEAFNYDVIIAGGGPAGASAAIHLAARGARVLLLEQKKFPRAKLCGEFISPECTPHFERLGVAERMLAANPVRLNETVFYSRQGKSVSVPSSWFGAQGVALGLSRAEMDERLLRRAREAGVIVLENAQVVDLLLEQDQVKGVTAKHAGKTTNYYAPVTIDATGRTRALARRVAKSQHQTTSHRASLVAFKAHLEGARVAPGACEIYFYRGGYGGLSSIEKGLSNLCFIASARAVRECGADAERVMRAVVCQNHRAVSALEHARACTPWLAVSLEGFGRHAVTPARGLLSIGDAASFIDPFTGSGMLMALESGELAANVISEQGYGTARGRERIDDAPSVSSHEEYPLATASGSDLEARYRAAYKSRFDSRLRICSMIRRAAFVPGLAQFAISVFGASDRLRRRVSWATRGGAPETYSLSERLNDGG